MQYPEGHECSRAATALLARFDRKQKDRWSEALHNIDFLYSSRVASSTLNNLTGRSRQSPCQYPVSANAIACQLAKHGKYEGANLVIYRLVMQESSDRWRATDPDAVNIFRDFSSKRFPAVLYLT